MSGTFPLVCVGGSAGSLSAFCLFLDNVPSETGCALVIVNHVRSSDQLYLPEILQSHTQMPVAVIVDGMPVQANCVYIIPGRCDLKIQAEAFRLEPVSKFYGWPDVITIFFRSVADNWKGICIAVVLSGLDSDGTAALAEIHASGGITIAQTPATANQKDMPEHAIESGCIDWVLAPEDIGRQLSHIASTSMK